MATRGGTDSASEQTASAVPEHDARFLHARLVGHWQDRVRQGEGGQDGGQEFTKGINQHFD